MACHTGRQAATWSPAEPISVALMGSSLEFPACITAPYFCSRTLVSSECDRVVPCLQRRTGTRWRNISQKRWKKKKKKTWKETAYLQCTCIINSCQRVRSNPHFCRAHHTCIHGRALQSSCSTLASWPFYPCPHTLQANPGNGGYLLSIFHIIHLWIIHADREELPKNVSPKSVSIGTSAPKWMNQKKK